MLTKHEKAKDQNILIQNRSTPNRTNKNNKIALYIFHNNFKRIDEQGKVILPNDPSLN